MFFSSTTVTREYVYVMMRVTCTYLYTYIRTYVRTCVVLINT